MTRRKLLRTPKKRKNLYTPTRDNSIRSLYLRIQEDWRYNGEDWTRPGFRALAMYRFGVWRMGIDSDLLRLPLNLLYRFMHRSIRNHYGIELHSTAKLGRRVVIAHQGSIVIHEFAEIGDDCVIRQGVTLGAAGQYSVDEAPRLGRGVTLGAGAVLVGSVKVGDGAKIGPNAVVIADVPAGSLAFAPPAKVITQGGFDQKAIEPKAQTEPKPQADPNVSSQPQLTTLQHTRVEAV